MIIIGAVIIIIIIIIIITMYMKFWPSVFEMAIDVNVNNLRAGKYPHLTLRLLMSYIYGAPSKARNANVVYIWTYVWQR